MAAARPSRSRGLTRAITLCVAPVTLALSGCSFWSPDVVSDNYAPSDGLSAELPDLKVRNLLVVGSETAEGPGVLSATLINTTGDALAVTLRGAGGALDQVVEVPADQSLTLVAAGGGADADDQDGGEGDRADDSATDGVTADTDDPAEDEAGGTASATESTSGSATGSATASGDASEGAEAGQDDGVEGREGAGEDAGTGDEGPGGDDANENLAQGEDADSPAEQGAEDGSPDEEAGDEAEATADPSATSAVRSAGGEGPGGERATAVVVVSPLGAPAGGVVEISIISPGGGSSVLSVPVMADEGAYEGFLPAAA